jgi:hypothetical protein
MKELEELELIVPKVAFLVDELRVLYDEYAVTDEPRAVEEEMDVLLEEIENLGGVVVDLSHGLVEFTGWFENRPIAYLWRVGDDTIRIWRYVEEDVWRPILDVSEFL